MLLKEQRRKTQNKEASLSTCHINILKLSSDCPLTWDNSQERATHSSTIGPLKVCLFPQGNSCCCLWVSLRSHWIPQSLLSFDSFESEYYSSLNKLASTYKVFLSYKPHTMGADLLAVICVKESSKQESHLNYRQSLKEKFPIFL